ncbi:hypothetical protein GX645_06090 [Candidatus Sumerlaeota bacterium]|nr:hypothetical protein [Candidatus Sumerlaeota bacterium]
MLLKLIKHDMIRRAPLYGAAIFTIIVLNIITISIWGVSPSIVVVSALPISIPVFFMFEVCTAYSRELTYKNRYMLFMTPNSGYKIILAKLLSLIIIGFFLVGVYGLIFLPNAIYISKQVGPYASMFPDVFKWFKQQDPMQFISLAIHAFSGIIGFILCIFTAQTLQTTFLSRIRFSKLIALGIFLTLLYIAGYCFGAISLFVQDILLNYEFYRQSSFIQREALWGIPMIIIEALGSACLVGFNGYLLEHKINL